MLIGFNIANKFVYTLRWEEIQTKGHPDKAPETWPALKTKADLVDIASSIIYTSSAQHVSFLTHSILDR